jgi:hypothetical protein
MNIDDTELVFKFTAMTITNFLDKRNILILKRYQLHLTFTTTECSNDIRIHTARKEEYNYIKEISCHSNIFLVAAIQISPRQQEKSSFFNSDPSKN